MGLFDSFKKKKPEPEQSYDPSNITVANLRKGFLFDYDLQTWTVKEEYKYDWGDGFFTKEFQVSNGKDSRYLHIAEDNGISLTWTQKVRIRTINEDLPEQIIKNDYPPKKLTYQNITYFLDGESAGYFNDAGSKSQDWSELISWEYYDESGNHLLAIEQWGERDFDAAVGELIQEGEISHILPSYK